MLILASTIAGCVPISAFTLLVAVPADITSSVLGLNLSGITAGIKQYKSVTRKKKRKLGK